MFVLSNAEKRELKGKFEAIGGPMNKPVILCVDDEKIILTSLKEQLKRRFGEDYSIETVESGEEALEIIDELQIDAVDLPVVIADQIMPGMKGDELLKQIHGMLPRTLKIMLVRHLFTIQLLKQRISGSSTMPFIIQETGKMNHGV